MDLTCIIYKNINGHITFWWRIICFSRFELSQIEGLVWITRYWKKKKKRKKKKDSNVKVLLLLLLELWWSWCLIYTDVHVAWKHESISAPFLYRLTPTFCKGVFWKYKNCPVLLSQRILFSFYHFVPDGRNVL